MDTIEVAFRVDPNQSLSTDPFWETHRTHSRSNGQAESEAVTGWLQHDHGDVRVTMYLQDRLCHLHFNAARLAWGKDARLLPPSMLVQVIEPILDAVRKVAWPEFIRIQETGEIVWDHDWTRQVRIRRIDLARNFLVDDPETVTRVLPTIVPSRARQKSEYQSNNGGWTLVNGTKQSGKDRLYDKDAELATHGIDAKLTQTGERLFRFETQIQKDRRRTLGLTCLADVAEEACWRALEARWEATRWGTALPTSAPFLDRLEVLSASVAEGVLGYLLLQSMGKKWGGESHQRDMAKRARDLGFIPGLPLEQQGSAGQYLSLFEGCLTPASA